MFILLAVAQTSDLVVGEPPNKYLRNVVPANRCTGQAQDEEIVVCGRRESDQRYRLRPIAGPEFEEKPAKAGFKLSENADLSFHGDSGAFGSPRAMVTVKLRF